MALNALGTHSYKSFIIQPGSMKLSPQLYLYVYIMCCIDIFELKHWSVLAKDPNMISKK